MWLPRCDSPTKPMENGNPDGGIVGLPYYDSRIDVCGFLFFGCHGVTALQPQRKRYAQWLGGRAAVLRQPH